MLYMLSASLVPRLTPAAFWLFVVPPQFSQPPANQRDVQRVLDAARNGDAEALRLLTTGRKAASAHKVASLSVCDEPAPLPLSEKAFRQSPLIFPAPCFGTFAGPE